MNVESVKKKVVGEQVFQNFETRIQDLSGNKNFLINNLSPEIQGIIKRFVANKARDAWEELGSCFDPNQRKSGFPHPSSSCENRDELQALQQSLFETLQIKKIAAPNRVIIQNLSTFKNLRNTYHYKNPMRNIKKMNQAAESNNTSKSTIKIQGKNLPPIFKQVRLKLADNQMMIRNQNINHDQVDQSRGMQQINKKSDQNIIVPEVAENQNLFDSRIEPRQNDQQLIQTLPRHQLGIRCQKYIFTRKSTIQPIADTNKSTIRQFYPNNEYSPSVTRYGVKFGFIEDGQVSASEDIEVYGRKTERRRNINLQMSYRVSQPKESPKIYQKHQKSQSPSENLLQDFFPIFKDSRFTKDKQFQLKYAIYREQLNALNAVNQLFVNTPAPSYFAVYKCFIGKGNNCTMVKQILKLRWWWGCVDTRDDMDAINFIWTQNKIQPMIECLKSLKKNQEIDDSVTVSADESYNSELSDNDVRNKQKRIQNINTKNQSQEQSKYNRVFGNNNLKLVNDLINCKFNQQDINLTVYSDPISMKIHNHLEVHFHLSNKKALFYNMRSYYQSLKLNVFNYLPLTFHIKGSDDTEEFNRLIQAYQSRAEEEVSTDRRVRNIWIVKPGENSNRGNGIRICSTLAELRDLTNQLNPISRHAQTLIVQQYMDRPLLYQKRKFDIRCFIVISCTNGQQKGYWYQDGYIRTSSKEFSVKNLQNRMVHLTNDAIQKKGDTYGRYERGNKVTYEELYKYLLLQYPNQVDFYNDIYPQMKNLARDCIRAVYNKVDPLKRENTFELFGIDFMIDDQFKVWLIEVNTNPCLETSSPLLFKIIPQMLDNVFKLFLDPLFPPPHFFSQKKLVFENILENNKFEIIFDEFHEAAQLSKLYDQMGSQLNIEEIVEDANEDADEEIIDEEEFMD